MLLASRSNSGSDSPRANPAARPPIALSPAPVVSMISVTCVASHNSGAATRRSASPSGPRFCTAIATRKASCSNACASSWSGKRSRVSSRLGANIVTFGIAAVIADRSSAKNAALVSITSRSPDRRAEICAASVAAGIALNTNTPAPAGAIGGASRRCASHHIGSRWCADTRARPDGSTSRERGDGPSSRTTWSITTPSASSSSNASAGKSAPARATRATRTPAHAAAAAQ